MRHRMSLAMACLAVFAGILMAQERIPLPAPDPAPAGSLPPPRPFSDPQVPPPPPGPPAPYVSQDGPAPPPPPAGYSPSGPYGSSAPLPAFVPAGPPYLVPLHPGNNPCCWIGFDALIWWTKNQPLSVPVVTTGPASQGANAGNLGMPGTTSLDGPLDAGAEGGFRFWAGGWFNADQTFGMDGSIFVLGQQSAGFSVIDHSGAGNFVINEPLNGAPFNTQVSAPGIESGGVVVGATTRFWGGDVDLLYNLGRGHGWSINLLGGYRFLELNEDLTIASNSDLFTTTTYSDSQGNTLVTAPSGSSVTVIDQFRTRNQFNGGQVGAQIQYLRGRWSLDATAKLGIGATHEVVLIDGLTTVFPVGANPVPLTGGNFASIQAGRSSTDHFALAPQAQLALGYQWTPWIQTQIGYDFLFLSNVVRPGNQIDNKYDGVTHPLVPMTSSTFWAQGLLLNLLFHF